MPVASKPMMSSSDDFLEALNSLPHLTEKFNSWENNFEEQISIPKQKNTVNFIRPSYMIGETNPMTRNAVVMPLKELIL